jgi:hypothetical protein
MRVELHVLIKLHVIQFLCIAVKEIYFDLFKAPASLVVKETLLGF